MLRLALPLLLASLIAGCDQGSTPASGGGAGGPGPTSAAPAILQPFQGPWKFNLTKTLAHWRTSGVPAADIAGAQKLSAQFPLHPDMNIGGDTAILLASKTIPMEGSYQFFALHPHKQWVCGKAWHHEDRHDPGDMDKYLIRLEIKNGDLHLTFRIPEDAADPSDPDVSNTPLLGGSAQTCTSDAQTTPPWTPWQTYVFDREGEPSRAVTPETASPPSPPK